MDPAMDLKQTGRAQVEQFQLVFLQYLLQVPERGVRFLHRQVYPSHLRQHAVARILAGLGRFRIGQGKAYPWDRRGSLRRGCDAGAKQDKREEKVEYFHHYCGNHYLLSCGENTWVPCWESRSTWHSNLEIHAWTAFLVLGSVHRTLKLCVTVLSM